MKKASYSSFLACFCLTIIYLFAFTPLIFAQEDPELDYYGIIEERNFFKPKDEPAVKEAKETTETSSREKTVIGIADLMLTGVVKIRDRYKAIIEKKDKSKGFYVKVDDLIEDYIVRDIRKNKVLLEKEEKVFELKFTGAADDKEEKEEQKEEIQKDKVAVETLQEEAGSEEEFKYEENMVQKLRTGKGGM